MTEFNKVPLYPHDTVTVEFPLFVIVWTHDEEKNVNQVAHGFLALTRVLETAVCLEKYRQKFRRSR